MEKNFIFIGDLEDPDNPGKTIREVNLEKQHEIPLGALVEIKGFEEYDYHRYENGLRLYVVKHLRDCDGTPLYGLSFYDPREFEEQMKVQRECGITTNLFAPILSGYAKRSLEIVRLPDES